MVHWDRSLIGQECSRFTQHVTRALLLEYADLMGARDPIHLDSAAAQARGYRDIIAPQPFVLWRSGTPLTPPAMQFHGVGINAGYECHFHRPVYPDDILFYTTFLVDMYEKTGRSGTMRFVVRETTVTNQHGELVAWLRNPFILD
ncbi:MAG: MaoC family dehydratase N-terminal domain-containing protein [Candidatus Tectimicrobiota bacterium]